LNTHYHLVALDTFEAGPGYTRRVPAQKKTFKTTIVRDGSMCFIPVPFDPKPVFGKLRVPVKVTLKGYTFRSTIASMGGGPCLPLRRSHREAAGLEGNETLNVTLELDAEARVVEPPRDLVSALKAGKVWEGWRALSYSQQRECVESVEGAAKPETRTRRIDKAVAALGDKPAKAAAPRLNAAWHARHPMPERATTKQRIAWHTAHVARCGCRPMPAKLRELIDA
jgi:hypothetical protein